MDKSGKELMVGLDIGTTRVIAMVAEVDATGAMEIIGLDRKECRGLREGVIVDIEATVQSINAAVEMVQRQADCEIHDVWATISGAHIECKPSHGLVSIKDNEVTESDMERVIELARTVQMPPGKEILHTLTQEYLLDNEGGIHAPLGMSGMRLEAKVNFITGSLNATQNLLRCVRRCGLDVIDLYFQPLASAESVLTADEKNLGVCLIDFGGGTTDFVVYKNMFVIHAGVIDSAGVAITNDIAIGLRTSLMEAEDIKRRFGRAVAQADDEQIVFEVTSHSERNNRMENALTLSKVLSPRVTQIFEAVRHQLRQARMDEHITGIVITGGSSLLYGLEDLCEHLFERPTRVGVPIVDGKLANLVRNPNYAAVVGLLRLAQHNRQLMTEQSRARGGLMGLFQSFREMVSRHF